MSTHQSHRHYNRGFALVTTLLLMGVFLVFLAAYTEVSQTEVNSTRAVKGSSDGFFAAEAGLNLRASEIRQIMSNNNRPYGTSPTTATPCLSGDNGSGDFICKSYTLNKREARTYVIEEPGNPVSIKIPANERYGGLSASESRYTTVSHSINNRSQIEAQLELTFRSREVPLFQFAAFYNKDLEILPGRTMLLNGPVHTNGDLYLNTDQDLSIEGRVTTAKTLYRGRKNTNTCDSRTVQVRNPVSYVSLVPSCASRQTITPAMLTPFNGWIEMNTAPVDVPQPEDLDAVAGEKYFTKADLRLVLSIDAAGAVVTANHPSGLTILNPDGSYNAALTNRLHACTAVGSTLAGGKPMAYSSSLYNWREGGAIRMLEVDMLGLFNCVHQTWSAGQSILDSNRNLNDVTEEGLVFHFSVLGPLSGNAQNFYGVRVRNGRELGSNIVGAAAVKGVTIVTDQALYVQGHYNSPLAGDSFRKPASFLSDSFQVLSSAWPAVDYGSGTAKSARIATNTTINAAVLSGTDTTGGATGEGTAGQNIGNYNGGLENYPRLLESWDTITFTYRGSFVSLNRPRHSRGTWAGTYYDAPNRTWSYDSNFNVSTQLPPLAPVFVYLRQELFVRDFQR